MQVTTYCREHTKNGISGTALTLKVQTRSSRMGPIIQKKMEPPELKWGVSSSPTDGKANEELANAVAEFFDIPKSRVSITKGQKSRSKVVFIAGLSVKLVAERLGHI
jgi:uncharacterized protein